MTENILLKVLKHYNITRMENQVGAEFNPQFHEAILKLKNEEMKSNTIQNVFKDGYLYHDRVLRAAQVSVVENEE
jgi:molecular chaperone GrpE